MKQLTSIPYTINDDSLTCFINGSQHTINKTHRFFNEIKQAILDNDAEKLNDLINVKQKIEVETDYEIEITGDDKVFFRGTQVPEYLAKRMIDHISSQENSEEQQKNMIKPLLKFAEKLLQNPTHDVREDLYRWLENGNMPICGDGDFLAYKVVNKDYHPLYVGSYGYDQSIGSIVEQPRETCETNRLITCSSGLHFCSYKYLKEGMCSNIEPGSDDHIIILKINPADVVSIPIDYELSKGRCCRFEVIGEVDKEEAERIFETQKVIYSFGTYEYQYDEDDQGDDDEDEYDDEEENLEEEEEEKE